MSQVIKAALAEIHMSHQPDFIQVGGGIPNWVQMWPIYDEKRDVLGNFVYIMDEVFDEDDCPILEEHLVGFYFFPEIPEEVIAEVAVREYRKWYKNLNKHGTPFWGPEYYTDFSE